MVVNGPLEELFVGQVRRGDRVRCCVVTAPGAHGKTVLAESLVEHLADCDVRSILLRGDLVAADHDLGDAVVVVVDSGERAPGALLDRLRADALSPTCPRSLVLFARSATASPELAELAALADGDDRLGTLPTVSLADLADRIPPSSEISAQDLHDLTGGVPVHVDRLCKGWDDEGWPSVAGAGALPDRFVRHCDVLLSHLPSEARVLLGSLAITRASAHDQASTDAARTLADAGVVDQTGRVPDAIAQCVDRALDDDERSRAIEAAGIDLMESDPARAADIVRSAATPPPWAASALAAAGDFDAATTMLNSAWDGSDGTLRAAAAHVAAAESRWSDAAEHAAGIETHAYWTDGQVAAVARMYGALDGRVPSTVDAESDSAPRSRFIEDAVAALAATLDPDADLDDIGDRLRSLARQSSNQQPMLDVAVSPAELAAVAALMAGEFGVAKVLIESSAEVDDRSPLNASLAEWVLVRAGHDAREVVATVESADGDGATGQATMAAARVLELAARVMATRRSGDTGEQADVLGQIAAAGAALSVDVLTFDALCELRLGAQRVDARSEARSMSVGIDALTERLGSPYLWDVRRRWNQVESAVAAGDVDALKLAADQLTATYTAGDPGGLASTLAGAAQQWVRVFAGQIDKRTLVECLDELESRGYVWEAASLAGQAAIRTSNAEMARELLQRGREYRQAVPEPMVTSPAGLSEREIEIGQLVLIGHSYKEIGAMCFISPKTVEHHIAHIRQKLAVVGVPRAEFRAALEADLGQA